VTQSTTTWGIITDKLCGGEFPSVRVFMRRLYFFFRLLAVALALPAILLYLAAAILVHPIASVRNRKALRIWMGVLDWIKGIPVGYSYWEQYQAPGMLDEIAVHHDD